MTLKLTGLILLGAIGITITLRYLMLMAETVLSFGVEASTETEEVDSFNPFAP